MTYLSIKIIDFYNQKKKIVVVVSAQGKTTDHLITESKELSKIPNIVLYNQNSKSGILAFNVKGVFSQDTSVYLNHYNIAIRAGNHCAKVLKDELDIKNTCRVSLCFYNTKEEVDVLINALKNSEDIFKVVI